MLQIPVQDLRRVAATLSALRGEAIADCVMRSDLRQLKIELSGGHLLVIGVELDEQGRQHHLTVDVVAPLDDLSRQLEVGLDHRAGQVANRGRLRFADFSLERLASGQCQARVVLLWPSAAPFVGEAQGLASQAGELRCAAQACLNGIARALPESGLELVGVKAVRAFDATVVIASLATQGRLDGPRVVGSALVQDDTPRGAAMAVLNASNRLLTSQQRR